MKKILIDLIDDLKAMAQAIVLGGSHGENMADEYSDYDLYVYYNQEEEFAFTHDALKKYVNHEENVHMTFPNEKSIALKDNTPVEIKLRTLKEMDDEMKKRLISYQASIGFSTCYLSSVFSGKLIYDRDGKYSQIVQKYSGEYPSALADNIIDLNRNMLSGKILSFDKQILKAMKRNDLIVVQSWRNEFLFSYFDILFAANRKYHIGRNRMLQYAIKHFKLLPKDIEKHIKALTSNNEQIDYAKLLEEMVKNLDDVTGNIWGDIV